MCDELQNVEEIECDDARATRKGSYSAWLKKTKSDNARFKMLQSSTTRYFTVDFDSQLFFYAHSEKQKKMSLPISFREILGAERLAPATSNKKAKNRSSGFVLKTKDRAFELYANSAADAAKWTFGLNAARDMGKASAKKGAVEKTESADLGSAEVDAEQQHQEQASQQTPEADEAAKKAKEQKDQKRQQEEADRKAALEAEKKGREDAEKRLQELEAKMKAKEAEEAERKSKEEAELRQRQELEAAEKQRREKEEEEASRRAREEAERLQKEEEEREAKRIAQERMLQEQEEARRREQEVVEQRLKHEEAERIAREQEESNSRAKEKAEKEKAETDAQNASKALEENEGVEQEQDDAALKVLLDASLQEEDPIEQQNSTAGIAKETCAEVADAAVLKADVHDVAQDAAVPALPAEDPKSDLVVEDKSQTSDAKSNQQDSLEVCKASDMQKEEPKEQKNEEKQRTPRGKGLQPLQPLKLKPLPKVSAAAAAAAAAAPEVALEAGNVGESAKIKAAEAAPMPPPCVSEPAKEQKADHDASGWDSDDDKATKNSGQKPAESCVAKAILEVPEGPVKSDSAENAPSGWDSDSEKEAKKQTQCQEASAPSGWDSEDETESKSAKKAEPTKSSNKIPEGPAQMSQESSGWDDDEDKPASVEAKAKTTEVPAKGAGHEPSGWDDEEDKPASADATKAKTEEAPAKGGMVLEFDMGSGPRKAPPRKLTDRLSKKSVSSKTRKRIDCQTKAPAAAPAAAPIPPSMPPPPKHNNGDDAACGAPPKPAEAFVPARPKTELTPAAPPPSANRDSDLSDLLTGALAIDTGLPSRGGSNSHGFVPNLHCTGCDFQVLRIENHVWTKGGDVSYMFLRNNYPNVMKLRSELEAKKGCSAFCCQCSSRSADAEADLSDVSEGLKWRQIQM